MKFATKSRTKSAGFFHTNLFQRAVKGLTKPELKAILIGGERDERSNVQQLLAAFTGRTRNEWESWSPSVARRRATQLEIELADSVSVESEGPILCKLIEHTLLANDLERWDRQSLDVLIDLLPATSLDGARMGALIATRADASWGDQFHHYQAIHRRLDHVIHFDQEDYQEDIQELPEWYADYVELSLDDINERTGIPRSTIHEKKKTRFNGVLIIRMLKKRTFVLRDWLSAVKLSKEIKTEPNGDSVMPDEQRHPTVKKTNKKKLTD